VWALVIGFVAGLVLGYVVTRLVRRVRRKYLAVMELWVFLPTEQPPSQDDLMTRMVRDNPFGSGVIGAAEGILFSDVRLHTSLVLRAKNPHVFRPDLIGEDVEPTPEALQALSQARALLKIRYLSEVPLGDARHVHFVTHMAMAAADLAQSRLVYDVVGSRLIDVPSLRQELHADPQAAKPELQVVVRWLDDDLGGHAETRGLLKVGLPELATAPSPKDQRVLILYLVEEAVKTLWRNMSYPEEMTVEAFDDTFKLLILPQAKGPYVIRIGRAHAA